MNIKNCLWAAVAVVVVASCSGNRAGYDEFTGITTEEGKWSEVKAGVFGYLKAVPVKITNTEEGTSYYGIKVAAGNAAQNIWEIHYPEIQNGESLIVIIDGQRHTYSTNNTGQDQSVNTGLLSGYAVEKAVYPNVPAEDLVKIALANDVKFKVLCKNNKSKHEGSVGPQFQRKFAKFVKEHIDPSIELPGKNRVTGNK